MTKNDLEKFADDTEIFFPAKEVLYIFSVNAEDEHPEKFKSIFPRGLTYYFKSTGKDALMRDFIDEKRIPGIDILWFDTPDNAFEILQGLGSKIRTVRSLYVSPRSPEITDIKKFLRKKGLLRYKDGVFVNKDVAPGIFGTRGGVIKKRTRRFLDKTKKTRVGKVLLKIKRRIQSLFHAETLIFKD